MLQRTPEHPLGDSGWQPAVTLLGISLGDHGSPPGLYRAVMGERKARGCAKDKQGIFSPLISKFLFILIKRKKKKTKHPHTPYVPTAPAAASVQRQKVERCLMSQLRGSSEPTPAGCVPGVPGASVQIRKRQVQN